MPLVSKATPTAEVTPQTIEEFVTKALGRGLFEKVVVNKVYRDHYRVNWVHEHHGRVVKSQFLVIQKVKDRFVIKD